MGQITRKKRQEKKSNVILIHTVESKELPESIKHGIETEYAHEIESRLRSNNMIMPIPDETQYARTVLSQSKKINKVINTIAGENLLNRAVIFLHQNGVENVSSHIASDDAADAIIEASEKSSADTIVMGCRGTGKLHGMVLGSVSQSVAHRAKCSVVMVK